MAGNSETLYQPLIDQLAGALQPVRRLWPVRIRLALFATLEFAILMVLYTFTAARSVGLPTIEDVLTVAVLLIINLAAAALALRDAVPGRAPRAVELVLLALAIVITGLLVTKGSIGQSVLATSNGKAEVARLLSWLALPAVALFIALKRGVTLRPTRASLLIGIAALSFGVAADRFLALQDGAPCSNSSILTVAAVFLPLTFFIGRLWLDALRVWREPSRAFGDALPRSLWMDLRVTSPLWVAASLLLVVSFRATYRGLAPVPELDLAIDGYERAMTAFAPNVPSGSVGEVLTAYVEHGMPSYMWDFGPEGFKLVGGRLDQLPDGTPVSFTLFRKQQSGVMCVFKPISGFVPPSKAHDKRGGMLFYRYRGYSVSLINLGNYGSFISVIVSPMPLRPFEDLVIAAAH